MRQCGIYKCPTAKRPRCCTDCDQSYCTNRCQNHPDRCNCLKDEPQKKSIQGRPPTVDPERVLSLAKSGMSNYAIAIELECSTDWVVKILRKVGYKRPRGKKGGKSDAQ